MTVGSPYHDFNRENKRETGVGVNVYNCHSVSENTNELASCTLHNVRLNVTINGLKDFFYF